MDREYWRLIALAIEELSEYGFIIERTQERMRNHPMNIDPVQVALGWSDVEG